MAPSTTTSSPSTRPIRTSSRNIASLSTTPAASAMSKSKSQPAKEPVKRSPATKTSKTNAKANVNTKGKAAAGTSTAKGSKRKAAVSVSVGSRKRTKNDDDDDDEEESVSDDQDQSDEYDQDDEDPEEDEDDSDGDDFQDDDYVRTSQSKGSKTSKSLIKSAASTSKSPSSSKAKSSTASASTSASRSKKSTENPDLRPAPSKTFLVSPLQIPRPENGPAADAIQPETLEFMRDLKLNNDREYMLLNKERFETAKSDFMDFIRMVKEGLLEADRDVMDQEPKDSMMRIYRDIRFSNDKKPYKSQLACHFSRGGRKSIAAGYYFGVSSGGETFAGCGVWDPSGPALQRIRHGIVDHADRFKAILSTDEIKQITGGQTGVDALRPGHSQLKTGPAGFDKNHPMIEYLKRKCFAVGRTFTDKEVVSEGFLEEVLQTFDACVDLVHILNEWIG